MSNFLLGCILIVLIVLTGVHVATYLDSKAANQQVNELYASSQERIQTIDSSLVPDHVVPQTVEQAVILIIPETNGTVSIDGEQLGISDLGTKLANLDRTLLVNIQANHSVNFQDVVRILDELKKLEFKKIQILPPPDKTSDNSRPHS